MVVVVVVVAAVVVTVVLVGGPSEVPSVLVTVSVLTSGSVTCDVTAVVILGILFTANIK